MTLATLEYLPFAFEFSHSFSCNFMMVEEMFTGIIDGVFHVLHVNISVTIFLLQRKNFYSVKIC